MPEGFWLTILGGFLAGCFGLLLFFIQRYIESKENEQKLLFQIYNLLDQPHSWGAGTDYFETIRKKRGEFTQIRSLSLLLKDRKLS